jgi:site-specific DNA recombinase
MEITMRAAIYSRFSTDKHTGSSVADQVRVCTEHAERLGWRIVEQHEDQGISGAALGNRPGVLRLQEAALARRFDVLLVTDLSRLSRSNGDLSKMIDRLVSKGLRVIGVQDGYDSARRGHKLQAGLSGIIGEAFREMIKDRTYSALESRARAGTATGGRAYGYHEGVIAPGEADIVREIFTRYAEGASCRTIATLLNGRGIPSPGSAWKRTQRRAAGWAGSGIRVILRNERYIGRVHWNVSEWKKDCDSGKRQRVMRPRSEWISRTDESQRIVPDELWQRCAKRWQLGKDDVRLKAGGKPKYLLSGLLRCDVCGAHYTITDQSSYGCSSYHDGRACANGARVRRDHCEAVLIVPVNKRLGSPERVAKMAAEMQHYYAERLQAMQTRASAAPRELQEIAARIERLRERLVKGDPDMPADEIQAAIDRAEAKRQELAAEQPEAKQSAKVLSFLPRAAHLYCRQITLGLEGDSRAALQARVFLRDWFGGKIRLEPLPDGGLMAHWNENSYALLKGLGTCGSGGALPPKVSEVVQLGRAA